MRNKYEPASRIYISVKVRKTYAIGIAIFPATKFLTAVSLKTIGIGKARISVISTSEPRLNTVKLPRFKSAWKTAYGELAISASSPIPIVDTLKMLSIFSL